ncbi:GNAT family N-acetyltransferase, partial [Rapidithrix thailandica]
NVFTAVEVGLDVLGMMSSGGTLLMVKNLSRLRKAWLIFDVVNTAAYLTADKLLKLSSDPEWRTAMVSWSIVTAALNLSELGYSSLSKKPQLDDLLNNINYIKKSGEEFRTHAKTFIEAFSKVKRSNLSTEEARKTYDQIKEMAGKLQEKLKISSKLGDTGQRIVKVGTDAELEKAFKWLQQSGKTEHYTDVVVHGGQNSFRVFQNDAWYELSHRDLAGYLKSKGYTGQKPVRLLACNTEEGITQLTRDLSNKLGREVWVPEGTVKVHADGGITIASEQGSGQWKVFRPQQGQVATKSPQGTQKPKEYVVLGKEFPSHFNSAVVAEINKLQDKPAFLKDFAKADKKVIEAFNQNPKFVQAWAVLNKVDPDNANKLDKEVLEEVLRHLNSSKKSVNNLVNEIQSAGGYEKWIDDLGATIIWTSNKTEGVRLLQKIDYKRMYFYSRSSINKKLDDRWQGNAEISDGWIEFDFKVSPELRNQGLGTTMFNEAVSYFKKNYNVEGIKGFWLHPDNYEDGISANYTAFWKEYTKTKDAKAAALKTPTGQWVEQWAIKQGVTVEANVEVRGDYVETYFKIVE